MKMLDLQERGTVTIIAMKHEKVNAMSLEFCQQLNAQLDSAKTSQCRAVVIVGNGRVFSAGVDLVRLVNEKNDYLDQFLPELIKLFMSVFLFPKPMVAAINGHAVAGGCVMACACDYRVVSNNARIGVPELRVGVPFPAEGLEIMRWAAADNCFREMINIGATFTGPQAVEAGLADECEEAARVTDLACATAERLITIAPDVFWLTKRHMRLPVLDQIERGNQLYGEEIKRLWRAEETKNSVKQYVAERLNK